MRELERSRILITAVRKHGQVICEERLLPFMSNLAGCPDTEDFKVLNLQVIVPASLADNLLLGLMGGDAELLIENVPDLDEVIRG